MNVKNLASKTLKFLTSPDTVFVVSTLGIIVKLAHQFVQYRQETRKIGFKMK